MHETQLQWTLVSLVTVKQLFPQDFSLQEIPFCPKNHHIAKKIMEKVYDTAALSEKQVLRLLSSKNSILLHKHMCTQKNGTQVNIKS